MQTAEKHSVEEVCQRAVVELPQGQEGRLTTLLMGLASESSLQVSSSSAR